MDNQSVMLPAISQQSVKKPLLFLIIIIAVIVGLELFEELANAQNSSVLSVPIAFVKVIALALLMVCIIAFFISAYILPPMVIGQILVNKDSVWIGNRRILIKDIDKLEIDYAGAKYDMYLHEFFFSFTTGKTNHLVIHKKDGNVEKVAFYVKKARNFLPIESIIEYWNKTYHNISYHRQHEQVL